MRRLAHRTPLIAGDVLLGVPPSEDAQEHRGNTLVTGVDHVRCAYDARHTVEHAIIALSMVEPYYR